MENQIVKGLKFVLKNIFLKLFLSYDGTTVISTVSTNHEHYLTSLGILRNVPIALGGWSPDNIKVERLAAGSWENLGDYPFAENKMYYYSFAVFNDALFVFGKK